MFKQPIYKQPVALFIATLLSLIIATNWVSVQAQVKPKVQQTTPPTFTKFQDAGKLNLSADGKPFKPEDVNQSDNPDPEHRGTIGPDDRIPMFSREYPWSAIGRIQGTTTDAQNYSCTGTLIGDDSVLTNAHCVIDPETHQLSRQIIFSPNVIDGKVADQRDIAFVERVTYGTDFTDDEITNQTQDWAIMKLNKPIGRKYGYLGHKSLPTSTLINNPKKFAFVGYSGDYPDPKTRGYEFLKAGAGWTAGYQVGCSIVKEERDILFHDCDTAAGSSGGPIMAWIGNKPYIVALNNAEIKNLNTHQDVINLAVKISFLDRLAGKN
ncbi:trypsin-like serine protease [Anabaena cylindrica UHCC 0172]|uniref:trypsin-like serine peptidase n=1 Tax=Anabaena cylindrica TaxID=1165 RepID=UPI002B1F389E|nr:trypsin-like serine protease [Anabaena cylindrica]MEA5551683.1 trypsin-like serine protease [Anabaena cylindrica UHCC 0172]